MPAAEVRATPEVIARGDIPASWDYDTLRPVAAHFGVSAEAFLRRLSTLGLVPVDLYRQRRAEFIAAHDDEADRTRATAMTGTEAPCATSARRTCARLPTPTAAAS